MPSSLTADIKSEALRLGFFACGMARAARVSAEAEARYRCWVGQGGHADMDYMQRNLDLRLDPRLLMPGAQTVVCVALNYAPAPHADAAYHFAAYALGRDYHDIVKQKLHQLAAFIGERVSHDAVLTAACTGGAFTYRAFCDSAPLWERYWAEQAGLGWTGRNHQLIIPPAQSSPAPSGGGTMFFLGELLLNLPLAYDTPMPNRCGACHRCIDACPTGALGSPHCETPECAAHPPFGGTEGGSVCASHPPLGGTEGGFNASLCLAYQTIEHRGPIAEPCAKAMGDTIYGCDRCQQACPWNRFATPTTEPQLQPNPELFTMTKADWQHLTPEDYRRLFKGSAVKRAKYEGLMRNIRTAADNQPPTTTNNEFRE